ncbi:hypothetical protein CIPOMA221M_12945 [Citrobacter portucalensis]
MQVPDRPQDAPVLALAGDSVSVKRMQNHAPYACMAFIRKNGGIFGGFLSGLLRGHFGASTRVNHALCRSEFFTIIIP